MSSFSERLRDEIEYMGMTRKELAQKADIKKRALDMYLGTQESMPPADVAIRLAKALNVNVEYLILGESTKPNENHCAEEFHLIENDLRTLPHSVVNSLATMIHILAEREKGFH